MRPFIQWVGGKQRQAGRIAEFLPEKIATYHEPFLGGGAVYLKVADRCEGAVLSDVVVDLVDGWRGVQQCAESVLLLLEAHAERHSKDYYLAVKNECPESLHERAARFIYLAKSAFRGQYTLNKAGSFAGLFNSSTPAVSFDAVNIRAISRRLQTAGISVSGFESVNPAAGDVVFCDPPYDDTYRGYTYHEFAQEEQVALRDAALRWAGAGADVYIMNTDTPMIEQWLYADFEELAAWPSPRAMQSNVNKTQRRTMKLWRVPR